LKVEEMNTKQRLEFYSLVSYLALVVNAGFAEAGSTEEIMEGLKAMREEVIQSRDEELAELESLISFVDNFQRRLMNERES